LRTRLRRPREAEQDAAAREPANPQPHGPAAAEPCRHPVADEADQEDAGRDGARMQADRALAEREFRLQERHDIALQVDGIEMEAGEEPAIPHRVSAQGGGGQARRLRPRSRAGL